MALNRILLLTDFSAGAQAALERANRIAADQGARLHVLHALGRRGIAHQAGAADAQAASEQVERLIEELRARGVEASGGAQAGSTLEAFEQIEEDFRPDLIVVGARGTTRLRRLLLGGTAQSIIQHAFAPVLVVRAGSNEIVEPFQRVLVATDFSPDPLVAASAATAIAAEGAALHLGHVFTLPPQAIAALGPDAVDHQRLEVKHRLDTLARELQAIPHFREGDAPRSVVRLANELSCDLIVLGTRGSDSASWFASGSVAGRILQLADVSVLAARRFRSRPEIREEFEAVRSELANCESLPIGQRTQARELLRNLRRLVDESQELRHEMLADLCRELDRLSDAQRSDHPKLASALGALARAIALIGV